ncbi:hypothetical protein BDF19DRAFT_419129 [Syncephalis fuscata]|nr:hypothetical protein BDF19DRAFT_419129 [Syncephalis fuscata]
METELNTERNATCTPSNTVQSTVENASEQAKATKCITSPLADCRDASTSATAVSNRMVHSREVEHKLRQLMSHFPRCKFHLHGLPQNMTQKLSNYLEANSAQVDSFFSADVTHLIVKDEAFERTKMEIEQQARTKKIIYHINLFKNPKPSNSPYNGDLASQLRNETIYGPSGQQHDIYYFPDHYCYLLIEDLTGQHRPPIVEKYPLPRENQEPVWPKLMCGSSNRSPFLKLKDTPTERPPLTAIALAGNATTSRALPLQSRAASLLSAMNRNDTPTTTALRSKLVRPVQRQRSNGSTQEVSVASGMHPSATATILSTPSLSTATSTQQPHAPFPPSKAVERLNRRALATLEENGVQYSNGGDRGIKKLSTGLNKPAVVVPTTVNRLSVYKDQENAQQQQALAIAATLSTKNEGSLLVKTARANNNSPSFSSMPRRPGYCESCKTKFEHLAEHGQTQKHRRFALNISNWNSVDSLLAEMENDALLVSTVQKKKVVHEVFDLENLQELEEEEEEELEEEEEEEYEDEDDYEEEEEEEEEYEDEDETTSAPCSPSPSTNVTSADDVSTDAEHEVIQLGFTPHTVNNTDEKGITTPCIPSTNTTIADNNASSDTERPASIVKRRRLSAV